MSSYNKVILIGNLTRDPEVKYTSGGTAIANFGMAINNTWTNKDGQKQEESTFVEIEAWERQAEMIGQYFKKGKPILVEGRLKFDQWDDKETGQKRSKLKVRLQSFSFIDSAGSAGGGGGGYQSQSNAPAASTTSSSNAPAANIPEDDDVPF
jgi:single-strand DNA-binding protein